ncbi:hypothetical protein [Sandaracinus amylolyticus]|uniref:Uncharacterized protein n=1 Tax=Sandaracinus amylolyticus TaxID=927083 RepID=A0A0F6W1W2_9BACT|nr:hypothetical protein [Sandaracinus amylolyticus]AKF05311.1 hypothetical protein DB32_002460 [Sandaracinus amylolyticus]
MRTREDIEAYLLRSNHPHRELAEDTWLVGDASGSRENIVVRMANGICLFRLKVIDLAAIDPKKCGDFYLELLRLNATEMVHGAYGASDGMVLLTASHLLENLDFNEFAGVVEEFVLAMANHHERIAKYRRNDDRRADV